MLRELPQDATSYYVYKLGDDGRPVHMTSRHVFNKIDWSALYRFTEREVEYIEFCVTTEVVSEYIRLTLDDGILATMQHLKVNGAGSHLGGARGKDAIGFITQSSFNHFIAVEQYLPSNGRIVSGTALSEGLGTPAMRSTLEYIYSGDGKLQQVIRAHDSGRKATVYAIQTETSSQDLADQLSEKIAAHIIEALKKTDFGSPLLCVELFYRQVTTYLPHVIPQTERDFLASPAPASLMNHKYWIDLNDQDFEPEMTEFAERLNTAEEWDAGTSMLRKAALLVTQRVPQLLPATDCFVAFAIDWEMEGQDFEAILAECGATTDALKKLKAIGWLD